MLKLRGHIQGLETCVSAVQLNMRSVRHVNKQQAQFSFTSDE